MCGIGLLLSLPGSGDKITHWNHQLSETLSSRGPDVPCRQQCCFGCGEENDAPPDRSLTLHASVLHMRGNVPTPQPCLFDSDCAFCWNGECYSYASSEEGRSNERNMIELTATPDDEKSTISSDTDLVVKLLQDALSNYNEPDIQMQHKIIANTLSNIHGEFAFILYVPSKSPNIPPCIYYGRDRLGRRSLLINKSIEGVILLSSVAMHASDSENSKLFEEGWVEIPPAIVFRMDPQTGSVVSSEFIPRLVNKNISTKQTTPSRTTIESDAIDFMKVIDKAVERRVANAPSAYSKTDACVAVLFSGGIDSVVLAALSHRHVPSSLPIDLINVSFFNDDINGSSLSPDRLAAILSYKEMQLRFPEREWRFIAVDVKYQEVKEQENHIRTLIRPLDSTMDFNIATAFWFAARGKGRLLDPAEVEQAQRELKEDKTSVDNNVLQTSSQQPLLRFATQNHGNQRNKDSSKNQARQQCIREGCSRHALQGCIFQSCKFCCGKLQGPISSFLGKSARLCPTHNQIDVAATGNSKKSKKKTRDITNSRPCSHTGIKSSAKILISGVGADEQLAGYGRHRTTFQRGGYDALKCELQMEVNRLWTRNLGRDDRVLCDHGKEGRFPFLDEDVVAYLENLPVDRKCDMSLSPGVGDKLLLREVARMIGVNECSTLVKRAIQFGSRIAKVSDKARFGSCRQATGSAKIPPSGI